MRQHPGDGAQAQAEDHGGEHRAEQGDDGHLDGEHLGPPRGGQQGRHDGPVPEFAAGGEDADASGFLLKDTPPTDLLAGIRVVAAGDALLAPSVTRQLIGEFARRPESDRPPPATLEVLTGREREVLTLVARGWSNAEIAERLYLSAATAKTHVGRLLMKLQARDRTQLVVIAYETGLVTPGGPAPSR